MVKKYWPILLATLFLIFSSDVLATGGDLINHPEPGTWTVASVMKNIFTPVWQFFVGITVIMFIVAGILFVTSSGDPGKIKTARSAVIWGVVGIIVAIIAFSIVQIVSAWV